MFKQLHAHRRPRRRGAIAVLVALCLVVLVSITAIALDGGLLLSSRRVAQGAADAGALAAASTILSKVSDKHDSNGKARQAAQNAVEFYVQGRADLTLVPSSVSIRTAPQQPVEPSATITNSAGQLLDGYIEVSVEFRQKRYFSAIFGTTADLPVRARAVARGVYERNRDGVIVLDPDDSRALHVHGVGGALNLDVDGNNVDIIVNSTVSDEPGAASSAGGATVTAPGMQLSGVESSSGGGSWGIDTGIVRHAVPTPDPLRHLPAPDPALLGLPTINKGHYTSNPNGNNAVTLDPGIYPSGITLSGNSGPLFVTMNPGIYYLADNGFDVSGQVNVTGQGVMIYNASTTGSQGQTNGISVAGGSTVVLTPLNSSDPYQSQFNGLSIYVNRDSGTPISLSGGSGTSILGTLYAANSPVSVTGSGDAIIGSRYISRTLDVGGNGNMTILYSPNQPPLDRILQLVE